MALDQAPGAGGEVAPVYHGDVLPVEVLDVQFPASLGPGTHYKVTHLTIPGPVGPVQVTRGVQVHWWHPPDLAIMFSKGRI